MTNLTFQQLNHIILTSKIVKSNEDVNEIIYNYYKRPIPKFKIGEGCIRLYSGNKKQFVSIDNIFYDSKRNINTYEYSYFPASDGYALESGLRKLTDEEKQKAKINIFDMPMDMCSWNY